MKYRDRVMMAALNAHFDWISAGMEGREAEPLAMPERPRAKPPRKTDRSKVKAARKQRQRQGG